MIGIELLTGPLLATFFLGITSILFLYLYSTRNFDYWKKRGVPYVRPIPFFGSTLELLRKPTHEVERERFVKYGPVFGYFEGSRPVLIVGDTKLIREVLVKEFPSFSSRRETLVGNSVADSMLPSLRGEDWKRVRSIVTPTFTTGKIRRMVNVVKECSQTLMQNLKGIAHSGRPFNVRELFGAFTMDVIASSAFSTKLDSHNNPKNPFVQMAQKAFSTDFTMRNALFQLMPKVMKVLKIPLISPEPMDFFKEVTLQILEERKRSGQTRNDFLQLLADTAKEVAKEQKWDAENDKEDITSNYVDAEVNQQNVRNVSNKHLSLDELVGQCVIFFLAGYDTTASTLSYASYELALHPEVQNELCKEMRQVLEKTKGELTYEALQEMKYLDNIISETLRMYPPVPRLERATDAKCELGDTGIIIPEGMVVAIPAYALHKDPKFFPDPDQFLPDRFTAEERAKRDPYSYMPFGIGPRNCVGMRFALMEIKVCLAYIVANFELHRCPQTKVPLEFESGPGLLIAKSIVLKLEPREEKILLK